MQEWSRKCKGKGGKIENKDLQTVLFADDKVVFAKSEKYRRLNSTIERRSR